ncbi:MAG: hypothetical protein J6N77_06335 [Lachnospiraceae bacterium]|nr:hypothetical protein [Lachnospiraceae bacterium]
MKKIISLILALVLAASLAGCGGGNDAAKGANQATGVNEVLESGIAQAESAAAEENAGEAVGETAPADQAGADAVGETAAGADAAAGDVTGTDAASFEEETLAPADPSVDVDLTVMSATMVYSEVFNMMVTPEDYVGKTVKMTGTFQAFIYEKTGEYYFTCVIQDATACCAQGMEFVLPDEYVYPDDYPEEGSNVTVIGTFDTYMEDDLLYCHLKDSKLVG